MMGAVEDHYAKEATRLLNDDVLAAAFETVRVRAMVRLTELDPSPENINEIRKQQAIANCLQDVRDQLGAAILATGSADGGFDPKGPSGTKPTTG